MQFRRSIALLVALALIAPACRNTPEATYGPVTYVAIGASDTVGVGAGDPLNDAWVAVLNRRLPQGGKFVRLGVSGSTAEQALSEQVPKAVQSQPDLITVWLAVNDFNARVSPETYALTLRAILDRLSSTKARLFVGNVPDLAKVPIYGLVPKPLLDQRVNEYNQQIDKVVSNTGGVLVDLFEASTQTAGAAGSLISEDGFHPSAEGHNLIADTFWDAIRRDEVMGPRVSR